MKRKRAGSLVPTGHEITVGTPYGRPGFPATPRVFGRAAREIKSLLGVCPVGSCVKIAGHTGAHLP